MDSKPSARLVLVHAKTKQRYPLRGQDFVIGRSQGDLIFDHDPKLSGRHCLIRLTPKGFAVHDLKSRTGVTINGIALPAGKACILKPGAELAVGDQVFTVTADRSDEKKKKRRTARRWVPSLPVLLLAIAMVGIAWLAQHRASIKIGARGIAQNSIGQRELPRIEIEMRDAIAKLQYFGEAIRRHEFTEEQSLNYLRRELIPRFSAVHTQLQAYRGPRPETEKKVDLQRRMAGAYLGQVTAMANYIQTKDVRFSTELGEYNRQMQVLNNQMHETAAR